MHCYDCGLLIKTKACEIHNPSLARICKNCCIKMAGHRCKWWEFCWPSRDG